MKIIERLRFSDEEQQIFDQASRWLTVLFSLNATPEELKAAARIREKNFTYSWFQLDETRKVLINVCRELTNRSYNFGRFVLENAGNKKTDNTRPGQIVPDLSNTGITHVALIQDPIQFATDMKENFEAGSREVGRALVLLDDALFKLKKDEPHEQAE